MSPPIILNVEKAKRERIAAEYRELRALDHDIFVECVEHASTIVLNLFPNESGDFRMKLGFEIEAALVHFALRIKGKP